MVRVLCCGTFDLLHPGHRDFLRQAAALGSRLCVVVARDDNVERLKGRRPLEDQDTRLANIESLEEVDEAHLGYPGSDFLRIVADLAPQTIALGYDQKAPPGLQERFPNCKIVVLKPHQPDKYKTTLYRAKLEASGDPAEPTC